MCRNFLSQRVNSGGRHVRQAQLRSVLFVHAAKRGAISAAGWPVCSAALYRSRQDSAAASSQSCAPPTKSALRSQTEKRKAQRRAPSSAPCRWSCWSGRGRRRWWCSSACSWRRSRRCWRRAPRAAARRCRRRRCGRAPPSARPQWRRSRPAPPWRSPAPAWSARRRAGGQRGRASRRTAGTGGARGGTAAARTMPTYSTTNITSSARIPPQVSLLFHALDVAPKSGDAGGRARGDRGGGVRSGGVPTGLTVAMVRRSATAPFARLRSAVRGGWSARCRGRRVGAAATAVVMLGYAG